MNSWMNIPPSPLYTRALSRQYPGLFVILLDQSSSMSTEIEERGRKTTKADVVTRHVNLIIQEMINNAGVEELYPGVRKKNAYLSVLGYDDTVMPLLSLNRQAVDILDIPTLARNPIAKVPEIHIVRDRNNNERRFEEMKMVWVKPRQGINTNMRAAFERSSQIIDNWLNAPVEEIGPQQGKQQPRDECFPPVVINITDGYYNAGGNPRNAVDDLHNMGTDNGSVLVFNCHFTTDNRKECLFPKDVNEVKDLDPYGYSEQMFYLSSIIPEPLRPRAQKTMKKPIEPGARCVVYNAKLDTLVQFLRWGTVDISASTGTRG